MWDIGTAFSVHRRVANFPVCQETGAMVGEICSGGYKKCYSNSMVFSHFTLSKETLFLSTLMLSPGIFLPSGNTLSDFLI